mmetsp:Transcript_3899/g.7648  ORF Transcript_3899/g.7648 Transcript_3899/m.7648 type:complete len:442 (+) Transcript_3899:100-1425(+)|eukprot:CAMPEP_0178681050 /NCGR_PEP_ID=MMETSP0699-20121125/1025_1 /TAXON_ID=265572 /ORGANISM="Extubocellulus spinifer, Strain CCMP396" /LENGTH=441 /DNA_ID=CAMNT_0020325475 /DNA_START=85 /DNA_END=1410 /DNA_ORIENTATION=+
MGDQAVKAGVAATAAVALTTAYLLLSHRRRNTDEDYSNKDHKNCSSFHVEYEHPQFPTAIKLIAMLPSSIRRYLLARGSAPSPYRDAIDVLGVDSAPDPYDIVELERDKIWRVRYKFLRDPEIPKATKMLFGKSFDDADSVLANVPPELKDTVANDIEMARKEMDMSDEELIEKGCVTSQDMLVARLSTTDARTAEDQLLLYNPCRMHPRIVEWLDSKGFVAYIVSGSSSHTNQLPQASEAFPSANIVCAEVAQTKCMVAGMRQADYLYTKEEDLKALNAELTKGGASLHFVAGDTFTHTAVALVHGHLFEVDLAYGHYCGKHTLFSSEEHFNDGADNRAGENRLFYYTFVAPGASLNGYQPTFRCMAMDPSSTFSKLMLDEPKADGSSCREMAMSLRKVLALPFDFVDMAHSSLDGSLPADEFRRSMDASWKWLDGDKLV